MRLIDADALMDDMDGDLTDSIAERMALEKIMNAPTIKEEPQRIKGRWIHDGYDIPHGVDWMHCSVCGRREPYVPAAMTNYCPTCGTEMETEQQ